MIFDLLPSHIGIVGSRSFAKRKKAHDELNGLVDDFVLHTSPNTVIVSGGAIGIDTYAKDAADKHGRRTIIIKPDSKRPVPQRYFERNAAIVKLLKEQSGVLICFIDIRDCDGTMNTLSHAKAMGVDYAIYSFTSKPLKFLRKYDTIFSDK